MSGHRKSPLWFVAACGPVMLVAFDASAMPLTLSHIRADLAISYLTVAWIYVGYAIAGACIPLLAGWLIERLTSRVMLLVSLAIVVVASLGVALSSTFATLEIFRILQAVGIASSLPSALAIIAENAQEDVRPRIVGIWGMVGGIAAVCGQLIAGLLIDVSGWQAVSVSEAVIALVSLLFGFSVASAPSDQRNSVNLLPIVLSAAATFFLAYGLLTYARLHGSLSQPIASITLAIVLAACAWGSVAYRRRGKTKNPDRWLLRLNGIATLCYAVSYICLLVALPLFLNGRFSGGTLGVALILTPAVLVSALVQPFAGAMARRWSHPAVATCGLLLQAVGLFALIWSADGGLALTIAASLIASVGAGLANPVLIDAAIQYAPREHAPVSGAVILTIRQLGFALGSAVVFAIAGDAIASPNLAGSFAVASIAAVVGAAVLLALGRVVHSRDIVMAAKVTTTAAE